MRALLGDVRRPRRRVQTSGTASAARLCAGCRRCCAACGRLGRLLLVPAAAARRTSERAAGACQWHGLIPPKATFFRPQRCNALRLLWVMRLIAFADRLKQCRAALRFEATRAWPCSCTCSPAASAIHWLTTGATRASLSTSSSSSFSAAFDSSLLTDLNAASSLSSWRMRPKAASRRPWSAARAHRCRLLLAAWSSAAAVDPSAALRPAEAARPCTATVAIPSDQ